jgi:hypothetical protein
MNRKQVNEKIADIVRKHESTFRDCPGELTVTLTLSSMIRELQAHMDEVVEAALNEGYSAQSLP